MCINCVLCFVYTIGRQLVKCTIIYKRKTIHRKQESNTKQTTQFQVQLENLMFLFNSSFMQLNLIMPNDQVQNLIALSAFILEIILCSYGTKIILKVDQN